MLSVKGSSPLALGAHTFTFTHGSGATALTYPITINVVGPAANIDPDAPSRVDPLGVATITVSVTDAAGNNAAPTDVVIRQVEGQGLIEGQQDTGSGFAGSVAEGRTSGGEVTFTYYAPSTAGTAVFRISAKNNPGLRAADPVVITVGDANPWGATLVSGWQNVAWSAGSASIADADLGGANITAIYSWSNGTWSFYFADDAAAGLNTLRNLDSGAAYWVYVQ